MRFLFVILALAFAPVSLQAQNDFGEKKDVHRVWKRWSKKKQNYNPYLDKKSKDKPSAQMSRENKRYIKKSQKVARKQMRRSKRSIARANRKRMKG